MTDARTQTILHEVWAIHQAFRKLGFSADNIFVTNDGIDRARGIVCVSVVLKTHGTLFCVTTDPVDDYDQFRTEWLAFLETANTHMSELELARIWARSHVSKQTVALVHALMAKGIPVNAKHTN